MISTIVLTIINWFLKILVLLLPTYQVWPQAVIDGITYVAQSFKLLNFIFPIDTLFSVCIFLIGFEAVHMGAKIVTKIVNFFRGADGISV